MYSERFITQTERGVYRRLFCSTVYGEGEYIVWLDLPVNARKSGRVVAYEFSFGRYVWRKGINDSKPSFGHPGNLFALCGKGLEPLAEIGSISPQLLEQVVANLRSLSAYLTSIDAAELTPEIPEFPISR